MSIAIEVCHLKKSFGQHSVLNNVDFKVPKGSIYGYLGRNGAGKTTTIDLLTGLIQADEGETSLFGIPSSQLSVDDWRKFAYVSEDQSLYEKMSTSDIVKFTSKFYPTWDRELEKELIRKLIMYVVRTSRTNGPKS